MTIKVGDIVKEITPKNTTLLWAGEVVAIEDDMCLVKWDPDYKLSKGIHHHIDYLELAPEGTKAGKQDTEWKKNA